MRRLFNLAVLATILLSPPLMAQTSKDYARMARATWDAFSCSSLAVLSGDSAEEERLFKAGSRTGLVFIHALKTGKIRQDDLLSEAPSLALTMLEGPTPDFILGRIYQSAEDAQIRDVANQAGNSGSAEVRRVVAQKAFTAQNCQLVGKSQ